jgi:hypothetical protein
MYCDERQVTHRITPITKSGLRFLNFAAAQAGRAHTYPLGRALHFRVDRAQIDVPAPLGHVMGVADVISELRPLAANFTNLCHDCSESNERL